MMAPLVGYFPSGFDPDPNSTNVGVFRHKQRGGTRLQLVVTPENEAKVDFVATSYAGEAQAGEYCSYGLGIFDKATRTLKIVPIANNKNKKMQMLKRENDPDAHNDLDIIKQCMTTTEDLLEASEGHMVRNTPPFNASATTPQEAYPLDKIISTGEWKFLQDIHKPLKGESELPQFVRNRIHKLQQIEDEDKKNKLTCIFSYIMHLIKFNDLHSKERQGISSEKASSAKAHRFPGIIRDKFASMFDAVSGSLSTEKRNLLISYVLVLTLFGDEFQISLTDIATDLRMKSPDLRKHYEALGCKVSKKNNLLTVTLPVPLQFPSLKRKRSNR
ncbi:hypothetical protein ACLB2K_011322 [Fragaria x ananassa]